MRKPVPETQPDEENRLLAGLQVQENTPLLGSGAGVRRLCVAAAGAGFVQAACPGVQPHLAVLRAV